VFVLITHLTSGTTEPARKLACDKMAAGDDDRDSAVRLLAFIMDIYVYTRFCSVFCPVSSLSGCLPYSSVDFNKDSLCLDILLRHALCMDMFIEINFCLFMVQL